MLENSRRLVAATIGAFVLWTAFAGQFESLVQRSVMVALLLLLGFLTYPLRPGGRARGWSIALDVVLAGIGIAAAVYVTFNANRIMTTLPMASPLELGLTLGLVVVLLELARRTVGLAFPILVLIGLSYVFLGHLIPGRLGHRGFDIYFIAETIYLSDIGVWGSLTGLASTLIAAFVLFGAVLLHTGGGKTFLRPCGGAPSPMTVSGRVEKGASMRLLLLRRPAISSAPSGAPPPGCMPMKSPSCSCCGRLWLDPGAMRHGWVDLCPARPVR